MTREEEIKLTSVRCYKGITVQNQAFVEGAQWADEHPKNPWRDAKKELPKDKGVRIFVSYAGIQSSAYYYGNNYWSVEGYGFCDFVDYWMPIPETPKGGKK